MAPRTEIFSLATEDDVELFCKHLKSCKSLGPKSTTFTIAVTIHRDIQYVELFSEEPNCPLSAGFKKLMSI